MEVRRVNREKKYFSDDIAYFQGKKVAVLGTQGGEAWIRIREGTGSFFWARPFMLLTEKEYLAATKD